MVRDMCLGDSADCHHQQQMQPVYSREVALPPNAWWLVVVGSPFAVRIKLLGFLGSTLLTSQLIALGLRAVQPR